MRARLAGPLAALVAFGLLGPLPAAGAEVADPSCGEMPVVERASTVVYALPHGFIGAGTDSVWTRSVVWRRGADYVLDRLRGELRLLREPIPGETLTVRACWLLAPPPLELRLMRYRPGLAAAIDSAATPDHGPPARPGLPAWTPGRGSAAASSAPGAALSFSGNKTIAVEFGSNQDAFLRQSLDLAVSGTLAPGVELTGVLSDRNTPLTAGGSTQSLESLDRVLIELRAPRGSAALGDVGVELKQGEFARLERRVQGMRAEWSAAGVTGEVALASAPGEYHRLQFFGVEGRQGPYVLTDRDGREGVSVVAGSEIVTLDGIRMTRGESADYSIDYERARITFTNRRPVTSTSRITVDYQFSVNRYKRNLVAAGAHWAHQGLFGYVQGLSEADDRGRPLDVTLGAADRLLLEASGDSSSRAIGAGVTAGGGDYDTVRVGPAQIVYAFAGPDSGEFSVHFANVGAGAGDYADSSLGSGQVAYRYVGASHGAYAVGRALPLPESHQLWSAGGGARLGALSVEAEGAVSRLDRNTFSDRDDGDDAGQAGRATVRLEGESVGPIHAHAGLAVEARAVGTRFSPFSRLERPFAEEDWGLPLDADLEHQRRVGVSGFVRGGVGGELKAALARLTLPNGFESLRRTVEWAREGRVAMHGHWARSDARQERLAYGDGGREQIGGDLRWRLRWIEPAVRLDLDERRAPSDTGRVGQRQREAGLELRSGEAISWKLLAGYAVHRDGQRAPDRFADQSEARTLRLSVDSPSGTRLGAALAYQRRAVEPLGAAALASRTRSDLGSLRLRGEAPRGTTGQLQVEVTSEAENRRTRELRFVGAGRGAYDALGNFVGTGDYDLLVLVSPELDRVARAATSASLAWTYPGAVEAWHGTRAEFTFESEARRRGEVRIQDPFVSPGAVRGDPGLTRGSVLQRLETELAPASRAGAVRVRAERRVTGDRTDENFSQSVDDRTLNLRWRVRATAAVSGEVEGRLRRQSASQRLSGGGSYDRVLLESGGQGQLVWSPDARLRAAAVADLSLTRPDGRLDRTRTLRVGPDLGVAVGSRGRAELTVRRGFESGPPAVGLLPTADPLGTPRWEGSARLDLRVRDGGTLAVSMNGRDRRGRTAQITGRVELRAFF